MSNRDQEFVEVNGDFVTETGAAMLIVSEFGEEVWVPKSLMRTVPEAPEKVTGLSSTSANGSPTRKV